MQNIPYVEKEKNTNMNAANMADRIPQKAKNDLFEDLFNQQVAKAKPNTAATEEELFDELFAQQDVYVQEESATAPLSTDEKMYDAAPEAAGVEEVEEKEVLKPAESMIEDHPADQKMTHEDFEEVRDDLEEYGLSEEEIQEIEDRIDSEEGLTWGQFVNTLESKISALKKVELSPEQTEKLNSFLDKLGFNETESKKLINDLLNGDTRKAMQAIMKKLESLPQDKKLLFSKSEVEAFAAAVNSSKEFTAEIKKMFSKAALPKDMKEAFAAIDQELAKNDQKELKLVRAVGETLLKAMGKEVKESSAAANTNVPVDMKERTTKNTKPEGREARAQDQNAKAEHAAAKDSVEGKNTPKGAEAPVKTAAKETESGHHVAARENEVRQTAKNTQENSTHKNGQADRQNPTHLRQNETGPSAQQDTSNQPFAEKNGGQENSWKQFFGRLREDSTGAAAQRNFARAENLAQALKDSGEASAKAALADAGKSSAASRAWEKISAPKVMRQINDALFTNLGQGKKQLTLQLKPEALGSVKVLLQVQGKEVNATIRAENAESARMINENIESLKQNLENQGLRVNKLEVQAGLADNDGSRNWQGEMQHNHARDRDEMARMRERMRNLRGEQGTLAHDMQNMTHTANVAEQGLHVIA